MRIQRVNQSQTKTFKGQGATIGPASWRSSGGGGSYYPSASNYGYNIGFNPFMYMWLANRPSYVQNISAEDIQKEQREKAKDKIFLQDNPNLIKKKHPLSKGVIAGAIASVASLFLTQALEFTKEPKLKLKNIDPSLSITSIIIGVVVGFAVRNMSMPNARIERLVTEEKNKQAAEKTPQEG